MIVPTADRSPSTTSVAPLRVRRARGAVLCGGTPAASAGTSKGCSRPLKALHQQQPSVTDRDRRQPAGRRRHADAQGERRDGRAHQAAEAITRSSGSRSSAASPRTKPRLRARHRRARRSEPSGRADADSSRTSASDASRRRAASDGIASDMAAIRQLYASAVSAAETAWESAATEGSPTCRRRCRRSKGWPTPSPRTAPRWWR